MTESSERTGALVVRAWVEPGRDVSDGLRARITYSIDLAAQEDDRVLVAAGREEIVTAVNDWLELFLGG